MGDLIDLRATLRLRQIREETERELARGRSPLYVSHATGKITGEDFGTRLARIRASLDKINGLMSELRRTRDDCEGWHGDV